MNLLVQEFRGIEQDAYSELARVASRIEERNLCVWMQVQGEAIPFVGL